MTEQFHGLVAAFCANARAHGNRPAVVCGEQEISYAELDARSNQIARLLQGAGVENGTRVGILLRRDVDWITALIAVVKAGGTIADLGTGEPDALARLIGRLQPLCVVAHSCFDNVLIDHDVHVVQLDAEAEFIGTLAAEPFDAALASCISVALQGESASAHLIQTPLGLVSRLLVSLGNALSIRSGESVGFWPGARLDWTVLAPLLAGATLRLPDSEGRAMDVPCDQWIVSVDALESASQFLQHQGLDSTVYLLGLPSGDPTDLHERVDRTLLPCGPLAVTGLWVAGSLPASTAVEARTLDGLHLGVCDRGNLVTSPPANGELCLWGPALDESEPTQYVRTGSEVRWESVAHVWWGSVARDPAVAVQTSPAAADLEPRAVGNPADRVLQLANELLSQESIGPDDNLFDVGATSLTLVLLAERIHEQLDVELQVDVFLEQPTCRAISAALRAKLETRVAEGRSLTTPPAPATPVAARVAAPVVVPVAAPVAAPVSPPAAVPASESTRPVAPPAVPAPATPAVPRAAEDRVHPEPLAIVGLALRLPGSESLDEFWDNLCKGRVLVTEVPQKRKALWQSQQGGFGAFLDDIECFDSLLFGVTPIEARGMDPQERTMLEMAWACLEDAGYRHDELEREMGRVGVYVGTIREHYDGVGYDVWRTYGVAAAHSNASGLSSRVSYFLGSSAPSMTVNTSCASSLTAIHLAKEALRNGDCDAALVGGVHLLSHPYYLALLQAAGFPSKKGVPRPFAADADGWCLGEGAGMLLLRPLERALASRDHVYGLLVDSTIGHMGKSVQYAAPRAQPQSESIQRLLKNAGLAAADINYIEAAAAGVQIGDAAEFSALCQVFGENAVPCAVGTVKAQIGHLASAAPMTQIFKALAHMRHRQLLACVNSWPLSGFVQQHGGAVHLPDQPQPWSPVRPGEPLRVVINSYGAGGAFGQMLLQSPPPARECARGEWEELPILFSAATAEAARTLVDRFAIWLEGKIQLSLADVAFTLAMGRVEQRYRIAFVAASTSELLGKMVSWVDSMEPAQPIVGAPSGDGVDTLELSAEGAQAYAGKWLRGDSRARALGARLFSMGATRIAMPVYPFARDRHWLLPSPTTADTPPPPAVRKRSSLEEQTRAYLRDVFAGLSEIPAERLEMGVNVQHYGIQSHMIVAATARLEQDLGHGISSTLFFERQTLGAVAEALIESHAPALERYFAPGSAAHAAKPETAAKPEASAKPLPTPINHDAQVLPSQIAIVGLAGRYPGASNVRELWRNLQEGRDCVTTIPAERWDADNFMPPELARDGSYCRWGGFIDDVDKFDPLFFSISPANVAAMDPQLRLFLQCAWEAVEDAGYNRNSLARSFDNRLGVFTGVQHYDYAFHGGVPSSGSVAHYVSYVLDLRGPSLAVDTLCSAALTAIHLAVSSIERGECKGAIAGAVNTSLHPFNYILQSSMNMHSSVGRCQAFGASADGFVPAEGVGAVVLRPLADALRDSDHVYGVIRGTSINSDGHTYGFTVPNPNAQADLVASALRVAGVDPRTISYVEAHGTGTSLGDPIEITGLTRAFEMTAGGREALAAAGQYCRIGSVKSNLGHCGAAAGIAGVTKVLLQLKHRQLVPSLHAETLNPRIDFGRTPFMVQRALEDWMPGKLPRRAGVSAFGAGGANAHVLIEEYEQGSGEVSLHTGPALIVLSARSREQIRTMASELSAFIGDEDFTDAQLHSVAWTLQAGRESHGHRLALLVADMEALRKLLNAASRDEAGDEIRWAHVTTSVDEAVERFESRVRDALSSRDWGQLRDLWLAGAHIDWSEAWPERTPHRLSLPTYPFLKQRYWMSAPSQTQPASDSRRQHPAVLENCSTLDETRFSCVVEPAAPTLSWLEIARHAIHRSLGDEPRSLVLSDVVWADPDGTDRREQTGAFIRLYRESEARIGFEIYSGASAVHGEVLCQGGYESVQQTPAEPLVPALDETKWQPIGHDAHSVGVQSVRRQTLDLVSWLDVSIKLAKDARGQALFDAMAKVLACVFGVEQTNHPRQLTRAWMLGSMPEQVRALIRCDLTACTVDADVLAEESADLALCIRELSIKHHVHARKPTTSYLVPVWQKSAPAEAAASQPAESRVVLFAAGFDPVLLNPLAGEPGVEYRLLKPEGRLPDIYKSVTATVTAAMGTARPGTGLRVLQLVIAGKSGTVRCLLGLYGLLATANREIARFRAQLIWLDEIPAPEDLRTLLAAEARTDALVVRHTNGTRLTRALDERAELAVSSTPLWRNEGTYLITGGLGGAGLAVAHEITTRCNRPHLVLVGRRDDAPAEVIQALESRGASVSYYSTDVADEKAVRRLIGKVLRVNRRINGILHCAGVIADSLIWNKTPEQIERVLRPKVHGTYNLDQATAGLSLDFFCCFSSIATLGNPGQSDYAAANGFMDAFAAVRDRRLRAGKRAGTTVSINWPYWKDGGMRAEGMRAEDVEMRLSAAGLAAMDTATAVDIIGAAVRSGEPSVLVWYGDAQRIRDTLRLQQSEPPSVSEGVDSRVREATLRSLTSLFSEVVQVPAADVDVRESLDRYGVDSIVMSRLNRRLSEVIPGVPLTLFYEHGTLEKANAALLSFHRAACERWIGIRRDPSTSPPPPPRPSRPEPSAKMPVRERSTASPAQAHEPVAIIGLSGRYPGAEDLQQFWSNLVAGACSITVIPTDRWPLRGFYEPDQTIALREGKSHCCWGGFIEEFAEFDPLFFNMAPNEAAMVDPQERLFLQASWQAFEDAGYAPAALSPEQRSRIAVFGGVTKQNFNLLGAHLPHPPSASVASLVNRVSWFMNLQGPSEAVDAMCASALVCVHKGCSYVRSGGEMAIVGAVNLNLHPASYTALSMAHVIAQRPDCRVFAEGADGFVPGEGVGVAVLKLLRKAEEDGDFIHAVIRGSAVNHSGKTISYVTPDPNRQASVIRAACQDGAVDPRTISYIESAANGARVGDPLEMAALTQVFADRAACHGAYRLGSIKPSIGHGESVSGMAQLTKVIFALRHGEHVPTLVRHDRLNPDIEFQRLPFALQRAHEPWQPVEVDGRTQPRRAGITSLGAGGVNTHVIVEEYVQREAPVEHSADAHLFCLSAANLPALKRYAQRWLDYLANDLDVPLARICFTLQVGRQAMSCRLAAVIKDMAQLRSSLSSFIAGRAHDQLFLATKSAVGSAEQEHKPTDLVAIAKRWANGKSVSWRELHGTKPPRRIGMIPTYPFEKRRCWLFETAGVARREVSTSEAVDADYASENRAVQNYTLAAGAARNSFHEDYLTFCPFEEPVLGFSLIRFLFEYGNQPPEWVELIVSKQREMRQVLFSAVDFASLNRVLDFGCGHGTDVIQIAEQFPHVRADGYTITKAQVDVCNDRVRQKGLKDRVRVYHRDSSQDPFPQSYDLAFGLEVSFHIRDKQALFSNLARSLRAGGQLLLMDYVTNLRGAIADPNVEITISTRNQWVDVLSANGFVIDEVVDVSPQIANGLHEQDFERYLKDIPEVAAAVLRNYGNQYTSLTRGWISYCLFRLRKREDLDEARIRKINEEKMDSKVRYPDALAAMRRGAQHSLYPRAPRAAVATSAARPLQGASSKVASGRRTPSTVQEGSVETRLEELFAAALGLTQAEVESIESLAQLGITSLNAVLLSEKINEVFDLHLPTSVLFASQSLADLASIVADAVASAPARAARNVAETPRPARGGIAIVGMSCRCAGSANPREFWEMVSQGTEAVSEIDPEWRRFLDRGVSEQKVASAALRLGQMSGVDEFDPLFFQVSPAEAKSMDPAHRILLQECYRALEDAACDLGSLKGQRVGTYIGSMPSGALGPDYSHLSVLGSANSILSARIAFFLDLKGPAMTVDTACSASLVAVSLAHQALLAGEIDLALAGGITLYTHPGAFLYMVNANMLSPSGRCRPFDADADGVVVGDGVGVVILKRLQDAVAERDHIYGVVRCIGVNQDGRTSGLTVPSYRSQSDLEASLYRKHGIPADQIQYVEAHGTATRLGDPVEIHALTEAFAQSTDRKRFCRIGSLKASTGHTSAAAGVLSLMKVALCLENRLLPPAVNFAKPNPQIDFERSPFIVSTEPQEWPLNGERTRLAAVSSFGFSGTNVHAVVEQAPAVVREAGHEGPVVIVLSARNEDRLRAIARDLEAFISARRGSLDLPAIAYTLQAGREAKRTRTGFVCSSIEALLDRLAAIAQSRHSELGMSVTSIERRSSRAEDGSVAHPTRLAPDEVLRLWLQGGVVDWRGMYHGEVPHRLSLPAYPFEPRKFALPRPYLEQSRAGSTPVLPAARAAVRKPSAGGIAEQDAMLQAVAASLAAMLEMTPQEIETETPFAELGLDSILALRWLERIGQDFGVKVEVVDVFNYPTVTSFAEFLAGRASTVPAASPPGETVAVPARLSGATPETRNADARDPIAIVGMSCRFAKSKSPEELWQHLAAGDDLVAPVARWPEVSGGVLRSCEASLLEDIARFDPMFFKISALEARFMDPQQRILLEECWHALEDAGYAGRLAGGECGVYIGCGPGDYGALITETPPPQVGWGNAMSAIAGRVAYCLDLKGPCMAVDTACSSSLTVLHLACEALRSGEIDLALVGGVYLQCTPSVFVMANEAGMLSSSKRCRAFDESADGIALGEGCAVVLLKRHSEAIRDRDNIHALVLGSQANQDGRTNGMTAPSASSQERLERRVYERFGIDPSSITMVEAHGTGTKLGDPIEFQALSQAFRHYTSRKQYCAIGSIKSNLGHTIATAGIAGVLKVVLAMRHRKIPPTLHHRRTNPIIAAEDSPFYINTQLRDWDPGVAETRIAAVSSFGFAGSNAHVAIAEPPALLPSPHNGTNGARRAGEGVYLVALSAMSSGQLRSLAESVVAYCAGHPESSVRDISFTLLTGRRHLEHRLAMVVADVAELIARLQHFLAGRTAGMHVGRAQDSSRAQLQLNGSAGVANDASRATALGAIAEAYVAGARVDFDELFPADSPARISLPTYPFAHERYWVGDAASAETRGPDEAASEPIQDEDQALLALREGRLSVDEALGIFE